MVFDPNTLSGLRNFNEDVYFNNKVTFFKNAIFQEDVTINGVIRTKDIIGSFSGDVTGNLTGNVIGDVSGSVSGSLNSLGISTVKDIRITGQLYDGDNDPGLSGQVLASDGTDLVWINTSDANVGSATSVGVNLDSTDSNQFVAFVGESSGTNPIRVDTQFTYNPSSNTLSAGTFSGSGESLSSLNASNLSSGTVPADRLPATLPASSGTNLTNLNATNLSSGTVNVNRLGTDGTRDSTTFLRGDNTWQEVKQTFDIVSKTSAYTLAVGDVGSIISITTGGVTVPTAVFTSGDTILIYNNSTSSQTITQGSNVTLRLPGTSETGNRTIQQRGLVTVLCLASDEFLITGTGLL